MIGYDFRTLWMYVEMRRHPPSDRDPVEYTNALGGRKKCALLLMPMGKLCSAFDRCLVMKEQWSTRGATGGSGVLIKDTLTWNWARRGSKQVPCGYRMTSPPWTTANTQKCSTVQCLTKKGVILTCTVTSCFEVEFKGIPTEGKPETNKRAPRGKSDFGKYLTYVYSSQTTPLIDNLYSYISTK